MARYKYKAFNQDKKIITDVLVADDLLLAKEKLNLQSYEIIEIQEQVNPFKFLYQRQLQDEDLAHFCGDIGVILESGVTIIKGLEILSGQTDQKQMKDMFKQFLIQIRKGLTMAAAMESLEVFPDLLVDMVASGEVSGNLGEVFRNMETYYHREASIKGKIKSASIYPLILLIVSVGMIVFFNLFVFKEMKTLFEDLGDLPALTSLMIRVIDTMNAYPVQIMIILVAVVLVIKLLQQIPIISYGMDYASLNIPLLGRVKKNIITARMMSSMGLFMASSVPLVPLMNMLERLTGNAYLSKKMFQSKESIVRGESIASSFESIDVFDSMVIQMIKIGEETGELENMLKRLGDIYNKKSDAGINKMVALMEPLFTLIVGVVVGIIIVAMALPIFDMSKMLY